MSTVIKVLIGRRFLPFWGEFKSQERFCRTGIRELDSKGWVIVCQVNEVRKGHPCQKEQHVWGQETAHLNGPLPCSYICYPMGCTDLVPSLREPGRIFWYRCWCLWADWSWEPYSPRTLYPFTTLTFPLWLFFHWHYKPYVECGARWSSDTKTQSM